MEDVAVRSTAACCQNPPEISVHPQQAQYPPDTCWKLALPLPAPLLSPALLLARPSSELLLVLALIGMCLEVTYSSSLIAVYTFSCASPSQCYSSPVGCENQSRIFPTRRSHPSCCAQFDQNVALDTQHCSFFEDSLVPTRARRLGSGTTHAKDLY